MMEILNELAKGSVAVFMGYVSTVHELRKKYNLPQKEVEELIAKNIKEWRKILE